MFAFRSKAKPAEPRAERAAPAHGAVRCPKCATNLEIRGVNLTLAQEFSLRCTTCHSRSFHLRSDMTSIGAGRPGG